ncbi:MAG: hypothetical protein FIA97_10635 [Methylococcaceae bacterium]|nr:hypothetical protein [Methylococcaceae bacterium]
MTQPRTLSFNHVPDTGSADTSVPSLLRSTTRSGTEMVDPVLAGIKVEATFHLGTALREGAGVKQAKLPPDTPKLLAPETEPRKRLAPWSPSRLNV